MPHFETPNTKESYDPLQDPYAFTTLIDQMKADGFPEDRISEVIGSNQHDIMAARGVYDLIKETQAKADMLSGAKPEAEISKEETVPSAVQTGMARAALDNYPRHMEGDLFDEPVVLSAPKQPSGFAYAPPPQSALVKGQDLSAEGVRAWTQAQYGRKTH